MKTSSFSEIPFQVFLSYKEQRNSPDAEKGHEMRSGQNDMSVENTAGVMEGNIEIVAGAMTSNRHTDIAGGADLETVGEITMILNMKEFVDPARDLRTADIDQDQTKGPLKRMSTRKNEVTLMNIEVDDPIEQDSYETIYLL
jgi:hypothetical protein